MNFLTRIIAFISAIFFIINLSFTKKIKPVYSEVPEITKTSYDEGKYVPDELNFFVSPDGDDYSAGSKDNPFKTINGAKEHIKAIKTNKHITVWFYEGEYYIKDTLSFTEEDKDNVTYRSIPGEKVSFNGAETISGFRETTVNGVRAFVKEYYDNGDNDALNTLYNNGKRLTRSTFPKSGEFAVKSAKDEDALQPDTMYFPLHTAMYTDTSDIMNFKNIGDVDVHIMHYWCDEMLPIHSVDVKTGRVEFQKPSSMIIHEGDRYIFENVFETLSEPGEWYYDRADGLIYYVPFENEKPDSTVLSLGKNETIIKISDCKKIDFKGITFKNTDWTMHSGTHYSYLFDNFDNPNLDHIKYYPYHPQACYDLYSAVDVSHSSDICFENCRFTQIGACAVFFGYGCKNCNVTTCLFEDIGANAVYIKGARNNNDDDKTEAVNVNDCHIRRYGRVFNNAIGILLIDASSCELANNEIHDGFYTAVSAGWVWGYDQNATDGIIIKDNLIYDIGQGWLADMGGIYTLGVQPNTVISGNVIHDVGCYSGDFGYGGWGIYLDEGSSHITVEKNLVYNCSSDGFHQHYGKENMIVNNIFALNGDGQIKQSRVEGHIPFYLINNIILSNDSVIYQNSMKDNTFVDGNNIYWDLKHKQFIKSGNDMSFFDAKGYAAVRFYGLYNNATVADPLFKDPLNGDFTLADNSPVFMTGFEKWDYSSAGTKTLFN